jgi:hypothetical protein
VLDEPGEGPWKGWIELPGVDPLGDGGNDVGAAAGPVAGHAIQVGSLSLVVTPVRGKRRCSWHWQDSAVLHRVNSVIRRGDKFRIDIGVGDGRDEV